MDSTVRALEVAAGKERWKGNLPAFGHATPMTYMWEGRQHVVICAGGHGWMGPERSDVLVAFSVSAEATEGG